MSRRLLGVGVVAGAVLLGTAVAPAAAQDEVTLIIGLTQPWESLNPVIGYDQATELAKEALATNKGILEIIREKKVLNEEQIKELLDPANLTGLDKA